jgi:hypothetical protein
LESTLTAAFDDLTGDIGHFLGYGRGANNGDFTWDDDQQADITRYTKGGLRKVYFCGYKWSFLQPWTTLSLPEGDAAIKLPDDFGGFEGELIIAPDGGSAYEPVHLGRLGKIFELAAQFPEATGRPSLAATEPIKGTGQVKGQRWRLCFYPTADADYSVVGKYHILPPYLSGAFPYVYGGTEHAELFLAACKSVAELESDDMIGPQEANFQRLLGIAQEMDGRKKPAYPGYNGDSSDETERQRYRPGMGRAEDYTVTFDGQVV